MTSSNFLSAETAVPESLLRFTSSFIITGVALNTLSAVSLTIVLNVLLPLCLPKQYQSALVNASLMALSRAISALINRPLYSFCATLSCVSVAPISLSDLISSKAYSSLARAMISSEFLALARIRVGCCFDTC